MASNQAETAQVKSQNQAQTKERVYNAQEQSVPAAYHALAELPSEQTAVSLRQATLLQTQHVHGNQYAQRMLAQQRQTRLAHTNGARIQRDGDKDKPDTNWKEPTDGVVQAWLYNQIDNWHTGAVQGLGFFKDAVKENTSVGFWLGLGGNVIWALGSLGGPLVAVTVGLIGVAVGAIGSKVQEHKDQKEEDRVQSIYEDLLSGFNDSRSKMDKKVIAEANRVMTLASFKEAVATKRTEAWQEVVRKEVGVPEGNDVNQVSKNTERNLYNKYLKERGAWVSHDIFHVPTPNHPGLTTEEKNFYANRIPDKVIKRLNKIGVNWQWIFELPIPHRHRDLVRKEGTIGAIEYWDYEESTDYPPSWTKEDIKEFLSKVPSELGKTRKDVTY